MVDLGSAITGGVVGNFSYDFVKQGLTLTGSYLKELALEKVNAWHFSEEASGKIAKRINDKGYIEGESKQEYCERLSNDVILKAMLDQFANQQPTITQTAENSPNAVMIGGNVDSLTINQSTESKTKKPKLRVSFLPESNLKIQSELALYKPESQKESMRRDSIPDHLQEFVSDDEIEKYNNALPSQKEVKEYNEKAILYFSAQRHIFDTRIKIENIGEHSANDVIIKIDFPDLVHLIHRDDIDQIEEAHIHFPNSPLIEAKKKYLRSKPKLGTAYAAARVSQVGVGLSETVYTMGVVIPKYHRVPRFEPGLECKDNSLKVRRQKVMHTQNEILNGYVIVPIRQGEGVINISVICEEYRQQDCFSVPISIDC